MSNGFSLDVQADFKEVEKMLKHFDKKIITQATTTTLNRVAKSVQSLAVKLLAKDIGIKQKDIRKYVALRKANWNNLYSSVEASGKRIPIGKLKARQTKKGVTYRGQGGGRKKIPGSFIAKMSSGHVGAYKRKGKGRTPLTELHGPSIPHVFIQEAINKALLQIAQERWNKEFPHQVNYRLKKAGYA